jgi:hypothetical protein
MKRSPVVFTALALSLGAALFVTPSRDAHAFCGFYVSGADAKLFNDATQVVLMREGQRTVLSMQNAYKGPPESFALVVPVPVVLQKENVKTLPAEIFDRVDALTAPRLVEYWEQDPCAQPMHMAGGGLMPMAAPRAAGGAAADSRNDLGVKIEAQFTVGEYEIVVLSAQDSSGLDTWLRQNKYMIPAGAEPYLRPYVQEGSKFFVAKVDVTKVKMENGHAILSPLRFHYDSERFNLPIRLGLINSEGTQDLIVNVLAKNQRYEAANYDNVTIPTNIDLSEQAKDKFGATYAALFDKTVEQHARAVVTEYAWGAQSCDPCPTPAAGLTMAELMTLGADALPGAEGATDAGAPLGPPRPSAKAASGSPPPMKPGAIMSGKPNAGAPQQMMPPRRPPWMNASNFVITRLHARYRKDALGDDLVFRAAAPIQGGREIWTGTTLEKGSSPSTYAQNNFQARYAIRHAWTGPMTCEHPVRGRWGGPPNAGGGTSFAPSPVQPATKIAFAPRGGGFQLAAMVREDVPGIGLKAASADRTPDTTPTTMPSSALPPGASAAPAPSPGASPQAGACGSCAIGSGGESAAAASALSLLALGLARVRRRARRPS